MKRLQTLQKFMCEKFYVHKKFYVHENATVHLSKIYFLKNAKKTCKPNNRDSNCDWIKHVTVENKKKKKKNYQKKLKYYQQKLIISS